MSLLILTVGTGTAGTKSNIVHGLQATIHKIQPRLYWLIPSTHEYSLLVADEVRAAIPGFAPYAPHQPYHTIEYPDQLEDCRQSLRASIRHARRYLQPNEPLIVNPTSGTKQMSAGATLAALDEALGEISFTIGERQDGVVISGTERLTTFDASAYHRERDFALAKEFFEHGSYHSATKILKTHISILPKAYATAEYHHHHIRLEYGLAAHAAARLSQELSRHCATLAATVQSGQSSPLLIADLQALAHHRLRLNHAEQSLTLTHKTLEFATRYALHQATNHYPPYTPTQIAQLPISQESKKKYTSLAGQDGFHPGLHQAMTILHNLRHPLALHYFADHRLTQANATRNQLTHHIHPITTPIAQQYYDLVHNLLAATIPLPSIPQPPTLICA